MDWTGGTRRRFAAKKGNAVAQKQKAYFARARAALNAPSQHAMIRSTIEKSATQSIRQSVHSHRHHSRKRHPERGSLDHYTDAGTKLAGGASKATGRTRNHRHHSRNVVLPRSRDHSSRASARYQAEAMKRQHPPRTTIPSFDGMSEEERLLLANRRRLLDRSDWLGLSHFQPVSMKFSSLHDRDRIGKRRKVDNSRSNRNHLYQPRPLTPLFAERLRHPDYVTSGALPQEDFHIKIGTDALGTQTQGQASRHSHMPVDTSMRPPSTGSDLLSEESMLLDADEAHFDPLPVVERDTVPADAVHLQTQHVCEVPNMQRSKHEDAAPNPRVGEEEHPNDFRSNDGECGRQVYAEETDEDNPTEQKDDGVHRDCDFVLESPKILSQPSIASMSLDTDKPMQHMSKQTEPDADEDDDRWRKFLDVVQQIPGNASTKAGKSSSLHVTSSEDDTRQVLMQKDLPPAFTGQHELPTRIAEAPMSTYDDEVQDPKCNVQSTEFEQLRSLSVSLKRITDLADHPAQATPHTYEEDKENALWREFVCGVHEDSDSSSEALHIDQKSDKAAPNVLNVVHVSSSYMVSDLGTSNKTTIGGDTIVVEESVAGDETYEIEDDVTVPAASVQSKNIHATRTLNPKRFLPPPKRQGAPPRRASRTLPLGHVQTKASKAKHSVFDLVDSDGNSLF